MQTRRGFLAGFFAAVIAAIAGLAQRPEPAAAEIELVVSGETGPEIEVEQLPNGYAAVYVGGEKTWPPLQGTLIDPADLMRGDWRVVAIDD